MRRFATLPLAGLILMGAGEALAQSPESPLSPAAVVDALSDADRVAEGVELLHTLLPTLSPARATLWIRLLAVAERSELPTTALAAIALQAMDSGRDPLRGATLIEEGLPGAAPEDRAALLGFAAHLADEADRALAARLRGRLLQEYPEAYEAPEAAFLRARWLLGTLEGRAEGIELLEELIVGGPNHPIAPEARRLLQGARARPGDLR